MSGRKQSRPIATTVSCSPACRNRPGRAIKVARRWYFHRFYEFQPDLDTANPVVQAEILKIMGFWLQLGVSGFRMDAVPFVIARKGADLTKPVEQYDMLRSFREFLQWRQGRRSSWPRRTSCRMTDHGIFR